MNFTTFQTTQMGVGIHLNHKNQTNQSSDKKQVINSLIWKLITLSLTTNHSVIFLRSQNHQQWNLP
jgi:hypothetical protein